MKLTRLIPGLAFLAFAAGAQGRLPEPDALWWGTLSHNGGQALTSTVGSPITVVAKYNGVVVAENPVPAGSGTYVLKVPLDDGVEPRVPGTVRPGERVHIFLRNTASNAEYEATETFTGPSVNGTVSTVRGTVYPLNLSVQQNLGTGGSLLLAFGRWAGSFPAINPANSARDFDGDGMSDFDEFLADTDPTSGASSLRILELARASQVNSIKFGPVRIGRVYSIFCSDDLGAPVWQKIGEVTPPASAPFTWFDHVAPTPSRFYKVTVGVQ